jgi:hypothetical protein
MIALVLNAYISSFAVIHNVVRTIKTLSAVCVIVITLPALFLKNTYTERVFRSFIITFVIVKNMSGLLHRTIARYTMFVAGLFSCFRFI